MGWLPFAISVGSGIVNYFSKRKQAKDQQRAAEQASQTALGGFNYLRDSPVGQQYLPAGGAAVDQQAALLGLGGDPAAAQQAYQNYLNSTGFQGQMQAGQQAITTSAAARGLLGSGSTAKALTRFGHNLGQQSFNNYLAQLHGVAGMGLQAGGMIGQAATQGYGQAANIQYGGATQAANTRAEGRDSLLGSIGAGYDAWQAGRRPALPGPQTVQDLPGLA